MKQDN